MGNLVDAEARGAMDTLAEAGRPLRPVALNAINDETALLMHFQLETIMQQTVWRLTRLTNRRWKRAKFAPNIICRKCGK